MIRLWFKGICFIACGHAIFAFWINVIVPFWEYSMAFRYVVLFIIVSLIALWIGYIMENPFALLPEQQASQNSERGDGCDDAIQP